MMVWDATCANTFTIYINCTSAAGSVARAVEERKRYQYAVLSKQYDFVHVADETSGVLGPDFGDLLREIGRQANQRRGNLAGQND